MKVTLLYKAVASARMSWLLFSITVERSGFPGSSFWSMFVMLIVVGAEDVTGLSGVAFKLYFFAFLFLAMLQVTKRERVT